MKRTLAAGLLFLCAIGSAGAEELRSHPFSWADMFAMVRLSDPQSSPDGQWILFTRTEFNLETNKGNTDLVLVSVDGTASRRLTFDPAPDQNGRFNSDGSTVFFLSNRSGSSQLYKLSLSGGEPEKVTDLPVDIEGFEFSPDGKRILFWADVFPDCKDLACTAKRLKEKDESKVKAMVFDAPFVRHWNQWNDGRRNHLFVMGLDDPRPVDLMPGMDQDAPPKPFGDSGDFSWSPDGKLVAFTSKPSKDEAWSTNGDVYLAPSDGAVPPRSLTADNLAMDQSPVFSPDGQQLAYLSMDRPGYESDRLHIALWDPKTGAKRNVTKDWDRSVEEMVWAKDGKTIYAAALEHGKGKIWAVDVALGKAKELVDEGVNSQLHLMKDGRLLFLQERMTHPKEIYATDPASGKALRVSHVNSERLSTMRISQPEEFWFSNDGRKLHGWILKPVDFREGQKYPLAFLVHGGPQASWEDNFHYRWNPEFYAGAGYVTVQIDFRGSAGYGQAFTDAIHGNWGPGPFSDLMAGLKEVLKTRTYIDKERMCALGASFGGYMTNWIAGQEHPFKCLVTHDGDLDTTSSYFNTDELWFPEWDMTGPPWEKADVYERNSPMRNVGKWKTPMLVIQGGKDFRVVEAEGISTFNALARRGIPGKFLYFPDEGHWVLKPQNSRLWHQTVLDWLDRWTNTKR
ncbi:MAG: S9 family peptidase [Pseudomonadota bacterium]